MQTIANYGSTAFFSQSSFFLVANFLDESANLIKKVFYSVICLSDYHNHGIVVCLSKSHENCKNFYAERNEKDAKKRQDKQKHRPRRT